MPKKRNQNFKSFQTQNQISQPSSSKDSSGSIRTVNERLSQLRAEQAPRPTIQQRNEMTTLATSHTLPPHIRRILDVPETAPPLPQRGHRRIMRVNGRRAPPGPAAPRSWLASSIHAPKSTSASTRSRDGPAPHASLEARDISKHSVTIAKDSAHALPPKGSLVHLCLRSMAKEWAFISEYEQLNLATLPIRWKTALLSYLGTYAPDATVSPSSLKTLFLSHDELDEATGGEELVRLDMTNLFSKFFTLAALEKFLYRRATSTEVVNEDMTFLTISGKTTESPQEGEIADSWDDISTTDSIQPQLGMKVKRFPNLTRLSLANAGNHASWAQLLSLTSHLPTLTHLSLANWPVPTTTPNSNTAFIDHNHASIPVSGSPYYNIMHDDWAEAASILKRLSRNTYQLRWLDLEGCADWLSALSWCPPDQRRHRDHWVDRTFRRENTTSPNPHNLQRLSDDHEFPTAREFTGPDWNGSWSQVTYVNILQGAIPRDAKLVRAYPAGIIAVELLLWLRDQETAEDVQVCEDAETNVEGWLQREKEARVVERTVRALRTSVGGKYCEFDHGWTRPVAAAAAIFPDKKDDT